MIKSKRKAAAIWLAAGAVLLAAALMAVGYFRKEGSSGGASSGQIYLYGEEHDQEEIQNWELELWGQYYQEDGMRHLFVEHPYYTAEFLNLWMQQEGDAILDMVSENAGESLFESPAEQAFFEEIKEQYPETVFHGTDVGHQHGTIGNYYLTYLRENGEQDSERFALAQEAVEQGEYFDTHADHVYRENKMTENFIREFDRLDGADVMGIYGAAHTALNGMDYMTNSVPCMASQLKERYGEQVHSEDLAVKFRGAVEPIRTETLEIGGKMYQAAYFGEEDLSSALPGYQRREFWRLENAYEDFKDCETTDVLPYDNFPMQVEDGQMFAIDYTLADGSVERRLFRADGKIWNGLPVAEQILLE